MEGKRTDYYCNAEFRYFDFKKENHGAPNENENESNERLVAEQLSEWVRGETKPRRNTVN